MAAVVATLMVALILTEAAAIRTYARTARKHPHNT